jgi:hypothetical protein
MTDPDITPENVARRVADLRSEAGDMAPRNPSRDALNQDADMLEALAARLAASEAREAKLRKALQRTYDFAVALEKYHGKGTGGRRGGPVFELARAALEGEKP